MFCAKLTAERENTRMRLHVQIISSFSESAPGTATIWDCLWRPVSGCFLTGGQEHACFVLAFHHLCSTGDSPKSVSSLFREQLLTHTCLSKVYRSCGGECTATWERTCMNNCKVCSTGGRDTWVTHTVPCSAWCRGHISQFWWSLLHPVRRDDVITSIKPHPNPTDVPCHSNMCGTSCWTSSLPWLTLLIILTAPAPPPLN